MCCQKNGSTFANTGLAFVLAFDEEDVEFDIYQRARDLMELSVEDGLHLWTLKLRANAVFN
jgi:hypothetical protein